MKRHPFYYAAEEEEYFFKEGCHILEVMNHHSAPNLSIARARVAPGVTTVLHALEGTEVYYILSGQGDAQIGLETFSVLPHQALYIAPGIPQKITNTGEEDLVFLAICTPRFTNDAYTEIEGKSLEQGDKASLI